MRIIIVGLGTIGKKILQTLSNENHSITLIDENKEKMIVVLLSDTGERYLSSEMFSE